MNLIPILGIGASLLASRTAQTAILRITGPSMLHVLGAAGIGVAVGNFAEREVKASAYLIRDLIRASQKSSHE